MKRTLRLAKAGYQVLDEERAQRLLSQEDHDKSKLA